MDLVRNGIKYGPAIAFVLYIVITWTVYGTSLKNVQDEQKVLSGKIEKIEANYDTLLKDVSTIKEDTSSIKTSIKYIERNI